MAVYRSGPLTPHASGPLGGVIARPARTTGVLHSRGARTATPAQAAAGHGSPLSRAARRWNTLPDTVRQDWNAWAAALATSPSGVPPPPLSGANAFRASAVAHELAGRLGPLAPSNPGNPVPPPALLDVLPLPPSQRLALSMLDAYPSPLPADPWINVFTAPPRPPSSPSNPARWRHAATIDLALGQPGIDRPPVHIDPPFGWRAPSVVWLRARTAFASGYVSADAVWPVFIPAPGELIAFRGRPVGPPVLSTRIAHDPPDALKAFTHGQGFTDEDTAVLGTPPTETIGDLAAWLATEAFWDTTTPDPALADLSATTLLPVRRDSITTGMQPLQFRVPAP